MRWYSLEGTEPIVDVAPLFVKQAKLQPLARVRPRGQKLSEQAEAYYRSNRHRA